MDAKELGNQPAHPVTGYTVDASGAFCGEIVRAPGLTKREELARAALSAVAGDTDISVHHVKKVLGVPSGTDYDPEVHWPQFVAKRAVAMADALLAELAKEQP